MISADFLYKYGMLVVVEHKRLIDLITNLSVKVAFFTITETIFRGQQATASLKNFLLYFRNQITTNALYVLLSIKLQQKYNYLFLDLED